MLLANAWTPEQWTAIIVIGTASFGGMVVQIINAIRQTNKLASLHNEVRPPSNGRTLGALVEGQSVIQHLLAQDYANRVREAGGNPPVIPATLTPSAADHVGDVARQDIADRRGVDAVVKAVEKVGEQVAKVHSEVETQNGLTMAALADRAEGRRIEAEVPEADRTPSEQDYVDSKDEPHEPKP